MTPMNKSDSKYDKWPSLRLFDKLDVPYVVHNFSQYSGPIWTGHCMMLNTNDAYGDEGFLHELFHWMVSSVTSRKYPDFKLGRWVNADSSDNVVFATSTTGTFVDSKNPAGSQDKERNLGWGEKPLLRESAKQQEAVACDAMLFYEPLVGLCQWGKPTLDFLAADDFGAYFDGLQKATTRSVYERIVSKLDSSVTLEQVHGHALTILS